MYLAIAWRYVGIARYLACQDTGAQGWKEDEAFMLGVVAQDGGTQTCRGLSPSGLEVS